MNPASAMAACRGHIKLGRAGQGRAGQGRLPLARKGSQAKVSCCRSQAKQLLFFDTGCH